MKNILLLLALLSLAGVVILRQDYQADFEHERISVISVGESVSIEDHLAEGLTIIEFGANW